MNQLIFSFLGGLGVPAKRILLDIVVSGVEVSSKGSISGICNLISMIDHSNLKNVL